MAPDCRPSNLPASVSWTNSTAAGVFLLLLRSCRRWLLPAYAKDAVDYAEQQGAILDYSADSVAVAERLAARLNKAIPRGLWRKLFGPSDAKLERMAKMLGGYVGEVLRREIGGEWGINDQANAVGLELAPEVWIFPTAKAHKRLLNGPEDSLDSFFKIALDYKNVFDKG